MDMESCTVPPGFRFHPTEEELVGYYLNRKVNSLKIDLDVIVDIDLYKMEPWDIQDRCKLGYEEQNEWYFFSHKDRKYPTGTRTNRATNGGFWKATGRDKAVISKENIIGMRKTLVYYKGRAPNGRKSDWIMHEYRLQSSADNGAPQEEGWVVCRAFKKPCPSHKQGFEGWSNGYFYTKENENYPSPSYVHHHNPSTSAPSMHSIMNPVTVNDIGSSSFQHQVLYDYALDNQQEMIISNCAANYDNQLFQLPQLDSPSMSSSLALINENREDAKRDIYMHQHQQQNQQQNDVNFYPSASFPVQNQNSLISRDDEFLLEYFTDL